jgi:glycine dehydrogenase
MISVNFSMMGKQASEMNMNVCYGSAQRFGVPMNFGGPHAGFFAFDFKYTRFVPGRIITLSHDTNGNLAYRMGIQTREQHIKREAATSNICTAQALLAIASGFYGIYHGEKGLKNISKRINNMANYFALAVQDNETSDIKLWSGYLSETLKSKEVLDRRIERSSDISSSDGEDASNQKKMTQSHGFPFYDTVMLTTDNAQRWVDKLLENGISVHKIDDLRISFAFDETTSVDNLHNILGVLFGNDYSIKTSKIESSLKSSEIMLPLQYRNEHTLNDSNVFQKIDIFDRIKGEHELMRYILSLENKDISLCDSMISLGSCTMKLNSAVEMDRLFAKKYFEYHPFSDRSLVKGYEQMISELGHQLCKITEMDAISFMSNSGATGEYLGILAIDRFHKSQGNSHRNICLIPESAHGTNPASAAKCGLKIVKVKNNADGTINMTDFTNKLKKHQEQLSLMMITYPSTYGVYESGIKDIIEQVHLHGGLIYMDGANLNAQLGITSPGFLGADVCHLNLHKTFCIPHGGGGPGMGPICFKSHLTNHVTNHSKYSASVVLSDGKLVDTEGPHGITSAPFSSAAILSISYIYIRAMGFSGLRRSAIHAMLNANYLASKIGQKFPVKYGNENGYCAHEFIIDFSKIKAETGISEEDIAKRLADFGLHAPTMSWPVPKTMMIEPTESENVEELDRFIDVFNRIREEIDDVANGVYPRDNNPLKNAPHTVNLLCSVDGQKDKENKWDKPYSVQEAFFPLEYINSRGKFWPPVGRIDNVNGDRNPIFDKEYK